MNTIGCYGVAQIKKRLKQWNIAQKKRWGQNFLVDKRICQLICEYSNSLVPVDTTSHVWEIGPGLGALTECLLEKHEGDITLFEIDYGIIHMLNHYIKENETETRARIIDGDAEHTIISHAKTLQAKNRPQIVYGNLPYSSSVRLLLSCSKIDSFIEQRAFNSDISNTYIPMCVMLQQEVAERLISSHGNKQYGVSSVLLQAIYDIHILYTIPSQHFYPRPHVESVLCSFIPRPHIPLYTIAQRNILQTIVHASFLQRRKTLRNTLGVFLSSRGVIDPQSVCAQIGISFDDRAECITADQYMQLAILLEQHYWS